MNTQVGEDSQTLHDSIVSFLDSYGFTSLRNEIGLDPSFSDDVRVLDRALGVIQRHSAILGDPLVSRLNAYCKPIPAVAKPNKPPLHKIDEATGNGFVSVPAASHSDDNQDRVVTGNLTLPGGKFTVVCDGVSNCGNGISGKLAAIQVTEALQRSLSTYLFKETDFPGGFNPTNPEHLVTLQALANQILLNIVFTDLTQKAPQTTLEIALQIPFGDGTYLVTLTCGDSGTVVVSENGDCHMMNVCENRTGFTGNAIVNLDNPDQLKDHDYDLLRAMANPGGTVRLGFFGNHGAEFSLGVAVKKLEHGDQYVVASDGFLDAFSVELTDALPLLGSHDHRSFNDLNRFFQFMQGVFKLKLVSNQEQAELLAALAYILSVKVDDVSVYVSEKIA